MYNNKIFVKYTKKSQKVPEQKEQKANNHYTYYYIIIKL